VLLLAHESLNGGRLDVMELIQLEVLVALPETL
jgi:hypothetical protein